MKRRRNIEIRKKLISTLVVILILRLGNYVPIPNIDQRYIGTILNTNSTLRTFFNSKDLVLSIFSLGIIPNINASLIMQLVISSSRYFERMQKEEGESGRAIIKQFTRHLTLALAVLQSVAIALAFKPIVFNWNSQIFSEIVITLTTGSMIVLWLSDLITEIGLGNGSSVIIALNIISALPVTLSRIINFDINFSLFPNFLRFTALVMGIICLQDAVKIIPIITTKEMYVNRNNKERVNRKKFRYLPFKINQGGIMPIIFSSSFLTFVTIPINFITDLKKNSFPIVDSNLIKFIYLSSNFVLIIFFGMFYSNLILNPVEIAKDLNKRGIIIPNIRPGRQTASFLRKTLNRLSFLGSFFLAVLVVIANTGDAFGFEITSLIILVGVIMEAVRKLKSQ